MVEENDLKEKIGEEKRLEDKLIAIKLVLGGR